jgi:2-oxo-4-hydroxy-4-carboxy--5-ureidoimidazoline (OHCU) decarboxylase
MRATLWTVVLWNLCGAGLALAQEKTEPPKPAESQAAPPTPEAKPADATTATPAPAAEPKAAPSATKAEEPGQAEPAKAEKAPAVKAAATRGPFQSSWEEASPDEQALFLEAFGESSKLIRERWDKASPDERKRTLRWHPVLGARPLKHHWVSATPEERAAFLESHPKTLQKVKEAWDNASPEQRKTLALEHPYFARKALHHTWLLAIPQEKIAFVAAHPAIAAELKTRWERASEWQKRWYTKNILGLELAKPWTETSTEERAVFLDANPGIAEKAREAWQKAQPEMRASMVRKWQGWPLKAYQSRLEKTGQPLASAKKTTRPAPPAKPKSTGVKK